MAVSSPKKAPTVKHHFSFTIPAAYSKVVLSARTTRLNTATTSFTSMIVGALLSMAEGALVVPVLIPKTYSDIVPHSRELISHLNASFYRVDEYALVSQRNIKQLLFPRSNLSQISRSAFSRILINMRAIFLKQNANDYCHLPSFLWQFHSLNPQSTVALQVADHDCFFQMLVAIPRAAAIFRAICLPMLFIDTGMDVFVDIVPNAGHHLY
jgi:hypothetical protein